MMKEGSDVKLETLLLCRHILGQQSLSMNAAREEVEAVLNARDDLDAAIAKAQANAVEPS